MAGKCQDDSQHDEATTASPTSLERISFFYHLIKAVTLVLSLHSLIKGPFTAFLWAPVRYWKAAVQHTNCIISRCVCFVSFYVFIKIFYRRSSRMFYMFHIMLLQAIALFQCLVITSEDSQKARGSRIRGSELFSAYSGCVSSFLFYRSFQRPNLSHQFHILCCLFLRAITLSTVTLLWDASWSRTALFGWKCCVFE